MKEQKENINNSEKNINDDVDEEEDMGDSGGIDEVCKEKIYNNEFDNINMIEKEEEDDNSPFIIYEEVPKKRKVPTFDIIEAIYNIEPKKRKYK